MPSVFNFVYFDEVQAFVGMFDKWLKESGEIIGSIFWTSEQEK